MRARSTSRICNLFALNRFPGYDRIEDGVRFTYGLDWQFDRPGLRIKTTVGPVLPPDQRPVPAARRHRDQRPDVSDFVGRTEVRYQGFRQGHATASGSTRTVSRCAATSSTLTVGSSETYFEAGYLRLNRDIAAGLEDLQDREELRVAGRVGFAKYWSVFGSAVVNLTDRDEDPLLTSDGFDPLRTRLGVAYSDDCLELSLTWRRDYIANGDAAKGDTFQIHFALKNLGFCRRSPRFMRASKLADMRKRAIRPDCNRRSAMVKPAKANRSSLEWRINRAAKRDIVRDQDGQESAEYRTRDHRRWPCRRGLSHRAGRGERTVWRVRGGRYFRPVQPAGIDYPAGQGRPEPAQGDRGGERLRDYRHRYRPARGAGARRQ